MPMRLPVSGFFGVCLASIVTMSAMNLLELPAALIPWLYFPALVLGIGLFHHGGPAVPAVSRREATLAAVVVGLLALPRLPYLFEPLIGHAVLAACWDDWWHIQEFAALAYTDAYPARSTIDQAAYLSFYYAPWMTGVALFKLGLLATIKQAVFLTFALFGGFFAFGAVLVARLLFPQAPRCRRALPLLVIGYGGFDVVYGLVLLARRLAGEGTDLHAEWWAPILGFNVEFSNFFTLALWTPHHFGAGLAVMAATWLLLAPGGGPARLALAGATYAFAVFASVFAVIGAAPIVLWLIAVRRPALPRLLAVAAIAALLCAPLAWLYLGKHGVGFEIFGALSQQRQANKLLAAPAFRTVIALEFAPILLGLWLGPRLDPQRRGLLVVALGFILSTFVVAYSGSNNYAMRGAIVPVFTLLFLATPGVVRLVDGRRPAFRALLAVYMLGGLWELGSFTSAAARALRAITPAQAEILVSNRAHGQPVPPALLQAATRLEFGWYLVENRKAAPKQPLLPPDVETMNADNRFRLHF